MLESEFQKLVLQAFKNDPEILLWRRNVGAHKTDDGRFLKFGQKGQSDLEGIVKQYRCRTCNGLQSGVHMEIELKTGKNKPTEAQIEWLNTVADYNAIAMVLYPEETDPIGLRDRIINTIYRIQCPVCYRKTSVLNLTKKH